jgi:hypothetical protein
MPTKSAFQDGLMRAYSKSSPGYPNFAFYPAALCIHRDTTRGAENACIFAGFIYHNEKVS